MRPENPVARCVAIVGGRWLPGLAVLTGIEIVGRKFLGVSPAGGGRDRRLWLGGLPHARRRACAGGEVAQRAHAGAARLPRRPQPHHPGRMRRGVEPHAGRRRPRLHHPVTDLVRRSRPARLAAPSGGDLRDRRRQHIQRGGEIVQSIASSGLWLPCWLRMNSIAVGTPRPAKVSASCPAPEAISRTATPAAAAPPSSAARSRASIGAGGTGSGAP